MVAGVLFFCLIGCATSTDRCHPDFTLRIQPIKTLCLLPPEAIVYEELPDGRLKRRSDRSDAAGLSVQQALVTELTARDFRVLTYPPGPTHRTAELQEVLSLYRAVNKSIQLHTFGPEVFTAKQNQFEYSVGPLKTLLQQNGADAFVFVRILYRFSVQQSRSFVSLGLADTTGTILWYGANGSREVAGIEDPHKTTLLVKKVLMNFPEGQL
jgi:hypothetical protein